MTSGILNYDTNTATLRDTTRYLLPHSYTYTIPSYSTTSPAAQMHNNPSHCSPLLVPFVVVEIRGRLFEQHVAETNDFAPSSVPLARQDTSLLVWFNGTTLMVLQTSMKL